MLWFFIVVCLFAYMNVLSVPYMLLGLVFQYFVYGEPNFEMVLPWLHVIFWPFVLLWNIAGVLFWPVVILILLMVLAFYVLKAFGK